MLVKKFYNKSELRTIGKNEGRRFTSVSVLKNGKRKKYLLTVCASLLLLTSAAYAETKIMDVGTDFECKWFTIDGQRTERVYFTSNMWANDSERIIVRNMGDGYLYSYNVVTDETVKLVEAPASYSVSANNWLCYVNSRNRSVNRIHLDTGEMEELTLYPEGSTGSPSSLHVTNDDTWVSMQYQDDDELAYVTDEEGNKIRRLHMIASFNITNGEWMIDSHEFDYPYPQLTHLFVNPVYSNLLFFCHEGTTTGVPDRLWLLDSDTGEQKNIFIQQDNSLPDTSSVKTGETSGHEAWTYDGEHMTFVKYYFDTNVGKSGIVRIDKYGEKREYVSWDYDYWHCHPAKGNRFIVADTRFHGTYEEEGVPTKLGENQVVIIDTKYQKAHVIANLVSGVTHPYQPHPAFSPDGKKVAFAAVDENNLLGVGVIDITALGEDQKETFASFTNEDKGVLISPVQLYETTSGWTARMDASAVRKDADVALMIASYDENGTLVEQSSDARSLTKGGSAELTASVEGGVTAKAFVVDNLTDKTAYDERMYAPERLRSRSQSLSRIELTWFAPPNFLTDKMYYEVYRDGVKLGETPYGYWKDSGLTADTEYRYDVRAVYDYTDKYPADQQRETVSAQIGQTITENGLEFYLTDNTGADAYTQLSAIGGRACYQSTTKYVGNIAKTGKFYFRLTDEAKVGKPSEVTVTVSYYDSGTSPIYIEYNAADGSIAKRIKLTDRTNAKAWKTASVTIPDAQFSHLTALSGYDFRVEGGANTYVDGVTVALGKKEFSPFATLPVRTTEEMKSTLTDPIAETGMTFLVHDGTSDCYSEVAAIGGRTCRKTAEIPRGDGTIETMLYFRTESVMPIDNKVTITVTYYDNGTDPIYIQYNAANGNIAKQVKLTDRQNTKTWMTASVSLTDASFIHASGLSNCDFRIVGGADTYVYEAAVTVDEVRKVSYPSYTEAILAGTSRTYSGVRMIDSLSNMKDGAFTATTRGGRDCVNSAAGKHLYFDVDDDYLYGEGWWGVQITFRYYDEGTGDIYMDYGTYDPTYTGNMAYKPVKVLQKTGTNTWKTATIMLVDMKFTNQQDDPFYSDFRLKGTDGLTVDYVRVVATPEA